jgi:hypothetical protein
MRSRGKFVLMWTSAIIPPLSLAQSPSPAGCYSSSQAKKKGYSLLKRFSAEKFSAV